LDYGLESSGQGRNFCRHTAVASGTKLTRLMNDTKQNVIIMAEDDADDRLLVRDALEECHWNADIRFVENGEELLDYLLRRGKYRQLEQSPRPGLILLDLNMPKKDGREVLLDIRANGELRRIPVVVLTT